LPLFSDIYLVSVFQSWYRSFSVFQSNLWHIRYTNWRGLSAR